ncbi:hypothetical protein FRC12_001833 [Ceratobasidium sp. 428]|nr:hypothetical protein FRC12_001833 [Ceratobasidium sp. 428]
MTTPYVSGMHTPTSRWDSHCRDIPNLSDGAYIVSGSRGKTIRIWGLRSCQQVGQPLEGHTGSVDSVAYSPDGAYIASGSTDKTIRIWDAQTHQQVGQPLEGHTDYVHSVVYSPDGAYIASGSQDSTIRIWDAHTYQQVGQPLRGHTSSVLSVAYAPDGAYITSGSSDQSVRIWDTQSVTPTSVIREPHDNSQVPQAPGVALETSLIPRRVLCNLGCVIDCPHMTWTLNEDGWIVSNNHKLIWVPVDLRVTLVHPHNTAVVHRRGFLHLDLNSNKLGDRWYESFQPGKSLKP